MKQVSKLCRSSKDYCTLYRPRHPKSCRI